MQTTGYATFGSANPILGGGEKYFVGESAPTDVQRSPIITTIGTVQHAMDVMARVRQLADRLNGPVPEAVQNDAPAKASGLFGELENLSRALNSSILSAERALARIESALPPQ